MKNLTDLIWRNAEDLLILAGIGCMIAGYEIAGGFLLVLGYCLLNDKRIYNLERRIKELENQKV